MLTFLIHFILLYLMFFRRNVDLLVDQLKILYFLNTIRFKDIFLQFKSDSLDNDYIFHWQKYKKVRLSHIELKFPGSLINLPKIFIRKTLSSYLIDFITVLTFRKAVGVRFYIIYDFLFRTFSFGFYYLRGFMFILFIDACLTDDEPLWEPIEWSLVQTWILFIFTFAWIAENLIVSRYGSYTGRDKRVWMSWYKTFWMIEGYYVLNYGVVCFFVIIPFYFELNYNISFIYSWWHWYSRVFFYKFIAMYSIVLLSSNLLQLNLRWLGWKKGLIIVLAINIVISYLIYTHFIMAFFGYFTDPIWYQKYRSVDYIQLSHEPSRWGWGGAKKDHFSYHNVKTVFWFKNDGPFASSFLLFHLFLFVCIFLLFIFWLSLLRRILSTKEIPVTLTTYCISSLRQFFSFFLFLYIFIFMSYVINYMRFPWEFYYFLNYQSWFENFLHILYDYFYFIINIFI